MRHEHHPRKVDSVIPSVHDTVAVINPLKNSMGETTSQHHNHAHEKLIKVRRLNNQGSEDVIVGVLRGRMVV